MSLYTRWNKDSYIGFYHSALKGCDFEELKIAAGYSLEELSFWKDSHNGYGARFLDFIFEGEYALGHLKIYFTPWL
jgi:hypothetical protein